MTTEKIGRNDPCPCGSGKKYKQCCQGLQAARSAPSSTGAAIPQAMQTAMAHHQAGRLPQAEAAYREILQSAPGHADALHYSGLIALQRGETQTAIALIGRALASNPDDAFAHCNMGNALLGIRQYADALVCYEHALRLKPDFVEAFYNRGNALLDLERYEEALLCNDRVLLLKPGFAEAHINRGKALLELKRYEEALLCNQRALQLKPGDALVQNNLGRALQALHRVDEAIACYRAALRTRPDYASPHNNLGTVLQELKLYDEAVTHYQDALRIRPDDAEAHYNLGNVSQVMDQPEAAILHYDRALLYKPDYPKALDNRGSALQALGRFDAAVASYRRALALKPDFAEAHNNLGIALQAQGKLDEAAACARRALQIRPDYVAAHGNLLFCLNYHPDLSAETIFDEYRRWNAQHARPLSEIAPHTNPRDPGRKLRIGYASPDLRRHSARHFIEPLLARHDRNRFEVFAYAQVNAEDSVSARFKNSVDHWCSTTGLSDLQMAEQIRRDGIDILIDLAGHTAGNRLPVFARKPAPVQVSWLGYGYTTGLEAIDYLLADKVFAPPGSEPLFSEKPVRLPCWAAWRPEDGMGQPGPLPALQTGTISFGNLSRTVRINHRVIRVWAAILQRVPGSRLILNSSDLRDPGMQTSMLERFAGYGIEAGRLKVGFDSPPWDVLRTIDIGLDCFPHNSGTTLFESLYMGVPFVTLADRPSVGRIGASVLTGLGHREWIAATEAEYADKAVALASDTGKLSLLRAGLRPRMEASGLMDEAAMARSVEAAYLTMWRRWCENLPVSAIESEKN